MWATRPSFHPFHTHPAHFVVIAWDWCELDWGERLQILFIGDIFGRPGRVIVRERLAALVKEHGVDLCIANGENAAGGFGLTPQIAEEFFDLGIDVITTGNHVWDKRELTEYFNAGANEPYSPARRVLRPANYPEGTPGTGVYEGKTRGGVAYAVIDLQGRVFMASLDDPFRVTDRLLEQIAAKVIIVDIHAEATSEKMALGWYLAADDSSSWFAFIDPTSCRAVMFRPLT